MRFTLDDFQRESSRWRTDRPEENPHSIARAYRKLLAGVLCVAIEDADASGKDAAEARDFLRQWGEEYCRCIYLLGGGAFHFAEFLAGREAQWALPSDSAEVAAVKLAWKRLRQSFKANGQRPSLSSVTTLPVDIEDRKAALLAHRLRWVLRTLARAVDERFTTLQQLAELSSYPGDSLRAWLYYGNLPNRPSEVVKRLTPLATRFGRDVARLDAEEVHRQLRHQGAA
jgi:hypothetical protein